MKGVRELVFVWLLGSLQISSADRVVELGPGIGRTAQLVLDGGYATYTGVDPNEDARRQIAAVLAGHHDAAVREGDARANGLPDGSADVVISGWTKISRSGVRIA